MVAVPRVAFVGGGDVGEGFLKVLAELAANRECEIVCAVATHLQEQKNPRIARICDASGIRRLTALSDLFAEGQVDVVVSAGNHAIFRDDVLSKPRHGVVNFHGAPLPEYRGSACPSFAILHGERDFGVTFLRLDSGLDTGPILHLERFTIPDDCTAAQLDRMCVEAGIATFRRIGITLLYGEAQSAPQAKTSRPPYRRRDIEAFRKVELAWPPDRILRHVRACDWDGVIEPAYAEIEGQRMHLTISSRGTWLSS